MGYIKPEFIDSLLSKVDILKIISDFVELKKSGANYKGLSPFSQEKSPSFMVSPAKQMWKDFSSGKGGNVVSFLLDKNYSFQEAIEYIASKYNENVEYESNEYS